MDGQKLSYWDKQFVNRLYQQHYSYLFYNGLKLVHDEHLAEDLAQETFRVACQKVDELRRHTHPQKWLMKTLVNLCRRQLQKRVREDMMEDVELCLPPVLPQTDIEEYFPLEMSANDRLILRRFYGERWKTAEIARELGLSEDAVKKRLQRLRKRLGEEHGPRA